MKPRASVTRSLWILALAAVAALAAAAGGPVSQAEALLFETNHLKTIDRPLSLHYDFRKSGTLEPGYADSVELAVRPVESKDTKAVETRYLSGARQKNFPLVREARGNPVLMYFLERDIHEMQRLTGGNWRYFQRRIRLAFVDKARVRPVDFVHDQKDVKGREIRITPFADDPQKSRYAKFAGKYYVFVLSDDVPGGVYQIRAVVPDEKAAGPSGALMEETLTFAKASRN